MPFQPVKAESLSAQVFDTIRNAIFHGELKPGETLRELGLAKSLNVSQATVREALAHLEQFGLVVRTPNRSTNVTAFSDGEALHRQRVRLALECLAFMEAQQTVSEEQLGELAGLADHAARALAGTDSFAKINAERDFHAAVWRFAGNPVLSRMLGQLTTPLFVRRVMNGVRSPQTMDYHGLVEQLRRGDRDSIVAALKQHVVDTESANSSSMEEADAVAVGSLVPA